MDEVGVCSDGIEKDRLTRYYKYCRDCEAEPKKCGSAGRADISPCFDWSNGMEWIFLPLRQSDKE